MVRSFLKWFVGIAFLALLGGWFVDRSNLARTLDHEREQRERVSEMLQSTTKGFEDLEAMLEETRKREVQREERTEAMAKAALLQPKLPEQRIAELEWDLAFCRSTFLQLGKLGANFRVFAFHRETPIPTLEVEGGTVTEEVATALSDSGIRFIRMADVEMTPDARAIVMNRYDYSHGEENPYLFELRGQVSPPLAK